MNFTELYEGVEPTLPGAPKGIKVMTPQQFVAKQGDGDPGEQNPDEQDVDENVVVPPVVPVKGPQGKLSPEQQKDIDRDVKLLNKYRSKGMSAGSAADRLAKFKHKHMEEQGVAEGKEDLHAQLQAINQKLKLMRGGPVGEPNSMAFVEKRKELLKQKEQILSQLKQGVAEAVWDRPSQSYVPRDGRTFGQTNHPREEHCDACGAATGHAGPGEDSNVDDEGNVYCDDCYADQKGVAEGYYDSGDYYNARTAGEYGKGLSKTDDASSYYKSDGDGDGKIGRPTKKKFSKSNLPADPFGRTTGKIPASAKPKDELDPFRDVNEDLKRIMKLSGLNEADLLGAPTRPFGGQDFQDYMARIAGTPDIDKKTGEVKLDKKGKEKYVSGKTKQDKYKMPYIHRSSVIKYYNADGKRYDEDQVKQALAQRPKKLLKQNEKMKHSNGDLEQFFNVGFAALVGIALDEDNKNLVIVNTCPGAGSCKIDCFAMKGGKIQFEAAWLSDGRILTYLLNDPNGFFNQLSSEISKEEQDGKKGGYSVAIRWHDAGDFFSPEYVDMAFKLAKAHPDVNFYAYTKMGDVAIGNKPSNFMINWSEGANTAQEKKVKSQDPTLASTKNSRIVPEKTFDDLLVKNEKGNLVKGSEGQWQVQPDKLPELKQRLAQLYGLSANSILSYDEWATKGKNNPMMKWNVIVTPGEPDVSATDPGVLSTLLLRH